MKAISICQPWASFIVECGKRLENRPRRLHYRGPVLIHASLSKWADLDAIAFVMKRNLRTAAVATVLKRELQRGGIIGIADMVDCISESEDPWFVGPFAYVLENVRPLPFYPCRGMLGLFKVDYPYEQPRGQS